MSKLETNQVDPSTGTTLTLGTSGDTIAIPSGVTIANSGTATGFGGDLTPAFQVTKSSAQTVNHATWTKVTWDTETYDTDSAFASDKFTVPSGEGGKYMFNFSVQVTRGTDSDMYRVYTALYKNGSQIQLINLNLAGTDGRVLYAAGNYALSLSASDYIEVYVNTASSSTNTISVAGGSNETSYFGGYKVLGA